MDTTSPPIGMPVTLAPGLRRVIAPNPSAMTFWGTNSYILGDDAGLCIIDPGPNDPAHMDALLSAIGTAHVSHIVVTHSHLDHSPLARPLAKATGAPILGFGPYLAGRSTVMRHLVEAGLDSGGEGIDVDFVPDVAVADGARIQGASWALDVIHTPGHLGNHICLRWANVMLTGDHVMGWSSSLVSPPDGDLTDFLASCGKLLAHPISTYFPGHGPPVTDPITRLTWLIEHRQAREQEIVNSLEQSRSGLTLGAIAAAVYTDTPPSLHPAATRNVLAHLIDLQVKRRVVFSLPMGVATVFSLLVPSPKEKPKTPLDEG